MSTGAPPGVLLDANIFYARTFRDWVVQLFLASDTPLFHVRWTQDVLAEWIYKYRKTHPFVSDSDLGKWRRRVEQTFPRGEITGYEIDPDLPYQDPHDAHLHAAAAHGKVDYVVSQDKGFARFADNDYIPYEVYTADDFFVLVNDCAPAIVHEAIAAQLRFHYRAAATLTCLGCSNNSAQISSPRLSGRTCKRWTSPRY